MGNYLAWDLEWDPNDGNRIDAVSFVDNTGWSEVKFRDRDFGGSEKRFLVYINTTIFRYKLSIGWNTQGSYDNKINPERFDLSILHQRCIINDVPRMTWIGGFGLPYFKKGIEHKHIDLINVYSKQLVREGVYHGIYNGNGLEEVSKAILKRGKYKGLSGKDFSLLPIDEAEKYSLDDSQLPMDLSQHKNFEILDVMLGIAEIVNLDFEYVCRTSLTTWWGSIFDGMVKNGECIKPARFEKGPSYKGATVLDPQKGYYRNVVVVDAKSLYPSVGIKHNLSFDTINCTCCKDDPNARIFNIPNDFTKDCKFIDPQHDWICKKRTGAFPTKLSTFRAQRFEEQERGNEAKAQGFKILINGGYGVFGFPDFDYYDPRVAELVTATGRWELSKMQEIAKRLGLEPIYGDTDSLFLNNVSEEKLTQFKEEYTSKSDIGLEIKNRYDKLLLSANAKHYIGYENGDLCSVGYEGDHSDRPEYFHKVYDQVIKDVIEHETDPYPNLKNAFSDLDARKVDPDLLLKTVELGQNPEDYKFQNSQTAQVGHALKKRKGELIKFYLADEQICNTSWTLNPAELDIAKYKEQLWSKVNEILEIRGYPTTQWKQEFGKAQEA